MKRENKLLVVICLTLVIGSLFITEVSEAKDKFVIAGIPEAPLRFNDSQTGQLTGIDVEIVSYIMDKLGIDYEIKLVESSTRLREKSKVGAYDMVFTYSYKESRAEYLIYAEEPHINISWNFFILKENKDNISYTKFSDLSNFKIGATKGFAYTEQFWQAANEGVLNLDITVRNSIQMKKLLAKRIDLLPYNRIVGMYEAKINGYLDKITYLPKPIKSKAYYNTFPKSSNYPNQSELIKEYDKVLREMKVDGTLNKILAKYGL